MTESPTIDIVLLDDHVVVRQALRALLASMDGLRVIGEASSVAELRGLEGNPRVVVSDLILAGTRGPEAIRAVHDHFPDARILVLSMVDNPLDVEESLEAGADGYVLKEAASRELEDAIRAVASGRGYLQPSLGADIARWRSFGEPRDQITAIDRLTPRELDCLRLIALGHTNAETARIMHVSIRTVESHRASLQRKIGAQTRAELVRHALELGLLDTKDSAPPE